MKQQEIMNTEVYLKSLYYCYNRIVKVLTKGSIVVLIWRAKNMGERIFMGAQLCNGISAVDNNLYMC